MPPKSLPDSVSDALAKLPTDGKPIVYQTWYDQVLASSDPNATVAMRKIVKDQLADLKLIGGQPDASGVRVKPVLHISKKAVS